MTGCRSNQACLTCTDPCTHPAFARAPPDAATNGPGGKKGNKLLSFEQFEFALSGVAKELGEDLERIKEQAAGARPIVNATKTVSTPSTRTLTLTLTLTLTRYKELEPLLRQSVDTFRAYPVKAVALPGGI